MANEQTFRGQFNIDVRTDNEMIGISPKEKKVQIRNLATGEEYTEKYDKLVLSPGAVSVRPPLPGIDLPGIFHVRTVPDARAIVEWIEKGNPFLEGMNKYSRISDPAAKTQSSGYRWRIHWPGNGRKPGS